MAKYREETISGTSYVRPRRIVIEDLPGKSIEALFVEERVYALLNGRRVEEIAGNCTVTIDGTTEIPIYNPNTGEVVASNTMTLNQIWRGLYSLYRHAAALRDAAA